MQLRNIKNNTVIDVPTEHAEQVLLPQGDYVLVPKVPVVEHTSQEPEAQPKPRGRPRSH